MTDSTLSTHNTIKNTKPKYTLSKGSHAYIVCKAPHLRVWLPYRNQPIRCQHFQSCHLFYCDRHTLRNAILCACKITDTYTLFVHYFCGSFFCVVSSVFRYLDTSLTSVKKRQYQSPPRHPVVAMASTPGPFPASDPNVLALQRFFVWTEALQQQQFSAVQSMLDDSPHTAWVAAHVRAGRDWQLACEKGQGKLAPPCRKRFFPNSQDELGVFLPKSLDWSQGIFAPICRLQPGYIFSTVGWPQDVLPHLFVDSGVCWSPCVSLDVVKELLAPSLYTACETWLNPKV